MIDFGILGSGLSGSILANLLSNNKYSVEVLDKAKGLGGRAANKRFKNKFSFDHGLQYYSPKNKGFHKFILDLQKKKIIKTWDGDHLDFTFKNGSDNEKFIGKNGNNDICKYLLKKVKTKFNTQIKKIVYKGKYWEISTNENIKINYKHIILTFPFPQTKIIAKRYLNQKMKNLNVRMLPNITVMVAFKESKNIPISSIRFNDSIIAWASNENSKKRFNTNLKLWTIQSNISFAKKNINLYKKNKNFIANKLIKKFLDCTEYKNKNIIYKRIHGWKYSYALKNTNIKHFWDNKFNLGICGDWLISHNAEGSWLSANSLFNKIKKNPRF